jgi:hypothetical protein
MNIANTAPLVNPAPSLTVREINALREAISPARLATYVRHAQGNVRRALRLYAWNVRAAQALFAMLNVNEIALRNAVSRALESQFGPEWPYAQGFLRTLPAHERDAFERSVRKLEKTRRVARVSTCDVVSAQTYYFWVAMLTSRYEQRVWQAEFTRSFPSAPANVDRAVVHGRAEAIRVLRNRIAHHEPLLMIDVAGAYRRALSMVRWISPPKATWAAAQWALTVDLLMRP